MKTLYLVLLPLLVTGCSSYKHLSTQKPKRIKSKDASTIKSVLCKDKKKIEAIERVSKRLTSQIKNERFHWNFVLVEKDTINATCLPNGTIVINSGVFKAAKNDDQLAAILAHEMSHVILKHGDSRINRAYILNGIEGLASTALAFVNPLTVIPFMLTYEYTTKKTILQPSSRLEEAEADCESLKLMKKANYNIDEAEKLWCNIQEVNTHKKNLKSTTHLSYDKRIQHLKTEIKKLKETSKTPSI